MNLQSIGINKYLIRKSRQRGRQPIDCCLELLTCQTSQICNKVCSEIFKLAVTFKCNETVKFKVNFKNFNQTLETVFQKFGDTHCKDTSYDLILL